MEKEEAEKWAINTLEEFGEMAYHEWLETLKGVIPNDQNSWMRGFYAGYIKGEQNMNKRLKNE